MRCSRKNAGKIVVFRSNRQSEALDFIRNPAGFKATGAVFISGPAAIIFHTRLSPGGMRMCRSGTICAIRAALATFCQSAAKRKINAYEQYKDDAAGFSRIRIEYVQF